MSNLSVAKPMDIRWGILICVGAIIAASPVYGAETDQYLTWEVELEDSADAVNAYLNQEIEAFLEKANRRKRSIKRRPELVADLYTHLFAGLHQSRLRSFCAKSPLVDRFPARDVSYLEHLKMSIYCDPAFPFLLPMARTIRIGDVYFGIDKIGHFFGFGRRYFQRYRALRWDFVAHEEAVERVIRSGLAQELSFVGSLVDGVFSHADLEANYQGFLLALDLASKTDPLLVRVDDKWRLTRPIDFRDYITPDFDESYNTSHFTWMRKNSATSRLRERYCGMEQTPIVQARFARYAEDYEPSLSKQIIDDHFAQRRRNPREWHAFDAICDGSE